MKERKALAALDNGDGWASRLLMLGPLYHHVLSIEDLGLPPELEHLSSFFDRQRIARIKRAVKEIFLGPHWARLEISDKLKLHVHVIARDGPLRGYCKEVYDLKGLLVYLSKSPFPSIRRNPQHLWLEGYYLKRKHEAKQSGQRLPRTSWQHKIPSRKRHHQPVQKAIAPCPAKPLYLRPQPRGPMPYVLTPRHKGFGRLPRSPSLPAEPIPALLVPRARAPPPSPPRPRRARSLPQRWFYQHDRHPQILPLPTLRRHRRRDGRGRLCGLPGVSQVHAAGEHAGRAAKPLR
jgi:hypothetical protein